VLREVRLARDHMSAEWVPERHIPQIVRHLKRVNEIFKLSLDSFAVLETLTPQDFLAFRKKLGDSSGFQSYQMREFELLLGLKPAERIRQQHNFDPVEEIIRLASAQAHGQEIVGNLQRTRNEVSLRDALLGWLYRAPVQGSLPDMAGDRDVVTGFVKEYEQKLNNFDATLTAEFQSFLSQSERYATFRARAALLFVESYRDLPLLSWPNLLIETVVEMEEWIVLWRMRHARMVERMIGRKTGTGGSGVAYLDATANYRIFHEFWTVRTMLLPREQLPPLRQRALYELVGSLSLPSKEAPNLEN
jgi:tryptophan 2,3-dioxygenase